MTLERFLVLQDRLKQLVADRNLRLALVTLRRSQAECQISAALRTIVPVVLLHVPILPLDAERLHFLNLLPILVAKRRLRTLRAVLAPKSDDFGQR